jgi:CO/xanthine dehydrogenase Mo-binding subunit
VWSHCQGVYNLRADLAIACALPPESIVVEHVEGAGCYGHNGADDVAFDAVLLARAAGGRPVRVQWSREDELAWSPVGAAMAIDMEADLDAGGDIVRWRHEVWSNGHVGRSGRAPIPTVFAASQLAKPFERFISVDPPMANGGGGERNAVPLYEFPGPAHQQSRVLSMPIRTSALRTLGPSPTCLPSSPSWTSWRQIGRGPARVSPLSEDPRARAVLEAAASRAGWSARRKREGVGHGIAFAPYKNFGAYCAVVAEGRGRADIRVRRLVAAVDTGEVINPDGLANQIEGGAIRRPAGRS